MSEALPPASLSRRSRWTEALVVTALWTLVGAAMLVYRALDGMPFTTHTIAVTAVEYGPWLLLTPAIFALARRLPLEANRWMGRLALHLALALGVAFAFTAYQKTAIAALGPPAGMGVVVVDRPGDGPLSGPLPARPPGSPRPDAGPGPGDGRGGPPVFQLSYPLVLYLVVLGVGFARAYALQARERQAEAARLDAERERLAAQLTEARLAALRMQLNPHFLFNALNAVSALAEEDPAEVRRVVARLSALLRRVLDGEAPDEVPLADELAFLRDYLAVQQVRFEERLEVEEDVAAETLGALVPSFILQPLVENAVEHGAGRVEGGPGRIAIHARRVSSPGGVSKGADRLVVTVRDNGPGLRGDGGRPGGIGLSNTRARLDAQYGPAGTLTIREAAAGGVEAEIALPYHATELHG